MENRERETFDPYHIQLYWKEKPNNPLFLNYNPRFRGRVAISLNAVVNPSNTRRIIINLPGLNESSCGPNHRYKDIANSLQKEQLGATVRSNHPGLEFFLPTTYLKKLLSYSQRNARRISGLGHPDIYMMGYSAGASAVAALASSSDKISKILLIAPSGNMPKQMVQASLEKYTGEVYILVGEKDEVVGPHAGEIFYNLATSASHRELFIIPNCDHRFQSKDNDQIFRRAPFYAFTEGIKPPLF